MGYAGSSQAEQAREKLGKALEALQQGEDVPKAALEVTEHIAQAVNALLEAERASTEPDGKACIKSALSALSQTMALLQDVKGQHRSVEGATEVLAEVLSSLFPLVNKTNRPPRPSERAALASAYVQPAPIPIATSEAPPEAHTAPTVPPDKSVSIPRTPTPIVAKPNSAQPPKTPTPIVAEPSVATPSPVNTASTVPPRSATSARLSQPAAALPNSLLPPVAPTPNGPREKLEANIGAMTQSNFYVGLSGEIAHGGVFVATYESLQKDESVRMLVTLPGGFEFECDGYVRFVRDPMDFSSESGPGMGIQFEKLGEEARELVLRFIRKRPPIFYDV